MALSYVEYTASGSTNQFDITFDYIDRTHIKVYVDNVEDTSFTFINDNRIQTSSTPSNGAVVKLDRDTPTDARLVDFQDGSVLTETDLDKSANQNFFISQETTDEVASKLGQDNAGLFDATNKRIINVADPTANQDAVTKYYLENTWLSTANKTALTTVNANIANINAVNSNESNINTVANDLNEATSEIDTVATNITNVNTVGDDITNVNTVATNIANVNTVAGIDSNVTTVAGISGNVTTVAGISSDVTSVAADATDIGAVASDISNVNTVAGSIANVNTAAGSIANINTVANDLNEATSEIDTVATNITNVNTVGNAITNVNSVASNISNVNSVASNSANINTVAGNNTNINTVASNDANITTVAGISSDVTAVANISTDIQAVQDKLTEVQTVADDLLEVTSEIDTVAQSIANVDTVGTNISNINTVAGISSNVTTVAGISSNVTTVAGISANVTAVAGDATDIGTVATDLAGSDNIGTVASGIANINTVAGISANVTTVAGISSDVTAVASDATDIGTVATNISNINSVASNSANINAVAGNETNINAVNTNSSNINTVAGAVSNIGTVATDITNVNTVASNITGVNSFAERYRVAASDPTTSLDAGDLVFNTGASALKYYDGSNWQQIVAGSLTDVVQDGTPELGGNLSTNGNDINFGNNDLANFGVGNQLQIYSTGTNSFIKETGTGFLSIQAQDLYLTDNGGKPWLFGSPNAEVALYYNNSKKFETTSTGIEVTGTVNTDLLDVVGDNSGGVFAQIRNSDPTQTGGAILDFKYGNTLTGRIQNRFDGSSFRTDFYGGVNGVDFVADEAKTQSRLRITNGGVTVNDSSNDVDFRVESDTNTHALFVDGGNSTVSINSSSNTYNLQVDHTTGENATIVAKGTAPAFGLYDTTSSVKNWLLRNSDGTLGFWNTDNTNGFNGLTNRVNILSDGKVGIGTDSPQAKLVVSSSATQNLEMTGSYIQSFNRSVAGYNSLTFYASDYTFNIGNVYIDRGLIVNESGIDRDFRVESNNNSNMLFVDGGNDRVGIANSNPSQALDVSGRAIITEASSGATADASGDTLVLENSTHGGMSIFGGTNDSSRIYFGTSAEPTRGLIYYNHPNNYMRLDAAGLPKMQLGSSEVVVNEGSYDLNFRVESNNNTHALFVDGGTSKVGINESSPSQALHVKSSSRIVAQVESTDNANSPRYASMEFVDPLGRGRVSSYDGNQLAFWTGATTTLRMYVDSGGHLKPASTNTYDLGSSSLVWRNIYTSDFHMSNEGLDKGNDIDGTKGSWTFQEGEENLYLINNKNGKKYKFNLTEIE